MTTYQTLQEEMGVSREVVLAAKQQVIGNRHTVTTAELQEIRKVIANLQKELEEMTADDTK